MPTERIVENPATETPIRPPLTPLQRRINQQHVEGGVLLGAGMLTHLAGGIAIGLTIAVGLSEREGVQTEAEWRAGLSGGGAAMAVGVVAVISAALILGNANKDSVRQKIEELRPYMAPLVSRDTAGVVVGGRF